MDKPHPINLTSDDHWRSLGWPALARDADGHAISTCDDRDADVFNEWLRECVDNGWSVTNLQLAAREGGAS